MNHAGLPVPPGIIISTRICSEYYENGQKFPQDLMPTVLAKLKELEERTGKKFGKSLLVSVRSGAPLSMPGMMDTILNFGLNDEVLQYSDFLYKQRTICLRHIQTIYPDVWKDRRGH